jgi:hypothetical protein
MKLFAKVYSLGLPGLLGIPLALAQAPQNPPAAATLPGVPVTKIVLYTSGVGYFQRDGEVEGRSEVPLRFKAEEVNDLLKSLVVQDGDGGQLPTVVYDSRDPVEKALKNFPIDLTDHPGLGALLQQIRGEPLEVATPAPVRGTILGVEKKTERVGEREVIEVTYLNLLTDSGLRTILLSQVQRFTLLNNQLDRELRQALDLLASRHNTEKKTLRVLFDGSGPRRVRMAYIVAMPVWKTSYRLVLADTAPPFLQGWAIVENTTDEDWQNVRLSLVSGRPISFVMDLYEPLYVERPVVIPELYAGLRPQVYEQVLETRGGMLFKADHVPEEKEEAEERSRRLRRESAPGRQAMAAAPPPPVVAESAVPGMHQGVMPVAQGAALGELFEYTIATPVSLARQTSALLPIVHAAVEGRKLSIYNARVHAKHPLHGVRLRNASTLHLMQGPITVFDGGSYVGDARLPDLAPGAEQLLSYAMDLNMEVDPAVPSEQQHLVSVSLRKGMLLATHKVLAEATYTIKNRDQKATTLLLEHPWRADWQLTAPAQPTERTRDAYRFQITVEPGQSTQLLVREEKPLQQTVRLLDTGADRIAYYLQAQQLSPAVKQALQKAVSLRERLDQTHGQLQRLAQRLDAITQEQSRIRENMERLASSSELYQRYVRKLDQQETEIENLRQESDKLQTTEERQKRELEEYLLGLDLS